MPKKLKYQIDALLKRFPYEDHSKLIKIIPPLLNIKESTFFKWKATDVDDSFEIPEGKFEMLCDMFEVRPEEMRQYKIKGPVLRKLLEQDTEAKKEQQ
jgi:hypothetical protein